MSHTYETYYFPAERKDIQRMKRVMALQFIWDDPPGYLGEIMQEHDILCEVVKVEEAPVPDPTGYDAFIAMGGPQHVGANDKYPYLPAVRLRFARRLRGISLTLDFAWEASYWHTHWG